MRYDSQVRSLLKCVSLALSLFILVVPSQAFASTQSDSELAAMDRRVLNIGHRLATTNAYRCGEKMPTIGLQFHSRDQYREALERGFSDDFPKGRPLAVLAVVATHSAKTPFPRAGDSILAIGEWDASEKRLVEPDQLRLTAFEQLKTLPANQPVALRWQSGADVFNGEIAAKPACAVLFEVVPSTKRFARSNGPIVQISSTFVGMLDDAQLAAVLAHEFAHSVLEHRASLSKADVKSGLFGEFGRSRKLKRAAEIEADRVSLHLLKTAGYDPKIAPAFWRSQIGRKIERGIFRSRAYPSSKERARLMEEELRSLSKATPE